MSKDKVIQILNLLEQIDTHVLNNILEVKYSVFSRFYVKRKSCFGGITKFSYRVFCKFLNLCVLLYILETWNILTKFVHEKYNIKAFEFFDQAILRIKNLRAQTKRSLSEFLFVKNKFYSERLHYINSRI
jgi:hypothetical protein